MLSGALALRCDTAFKLETLSLILVLRTPKTSSKNLFLFCNYVEDIRSELCLPLTPEKNEPPFLVFPPRRLHQNKKYKGVHNL